MIVWLRFSACICLLFGGCDTSPSGQDVGAFSHDVVKYNQEMAKLQNAYGEIDVSWDAGLHVLSIKDRLGLVVGEIIIDHGYTVTLNNNPTRIRESGSNVIIGSIGNGSGLGSSLRCYKE